jgi:hypothetical protein
MTRSYPLLPSFYIGHGKSHQGTHRMTTKRRTNFPTAPTLQFHAVPLEDTASVEDVAKDEDSRAQTRAS